MRGSTGAPIRSRGCIRRPCAQFPVHVNLRTRAFRLHPKPLVFVLALHDAAPRTEVFIIGAPKCATTAVAYALASHPQVAFCRLKEPRFFSNEAVRSRGLDWYHGLFGQAAGVRAEASTSYSEAWRDRHRISAERIHAYNPSSRIIYCVRHPLQRAVSEWREFANQLRIGNPYMEKNYGITSQRGLNADLQSVFGYVDTSNYWNTLAIYRQYFPDSQMHVVFQEDWARAPASELARILRFIGVGDQFQPPTIHEVVNDKWSKARPRLLLALAQAIPGYRFLAGWAPRRARALMRPLLKHHPDSGVVVSPETVTVARQRIGADIERFLEWRGLSPNHWTW